MAETKALRTHIEELVERTQDEILDASRDLAEGISKEAGRFVPPISADIEQLVDNVFDFAERVMRGQRRMVNDLVKVINEQTERAAGVGQATTRKAVGRVSAAKSAVADRVPARKGSRTATTAKKRSPSKRAPQKAAKRPAATGR
jgi:hypothetical protein